MQPIFTMQYGEFAVADYLSKKIKNVSVFIPASAQEKGIDLLLYRYDHNCNKAMYYPKLSGRSQMLPGMTAGSKR